MTPQHGPVATGRQAAVREREDAVVARLRSLSTVIDGEPDPAFRAASRARLVAMAAVRSPAPAAASRSVWQRLLSVRAEDAAPARWRVRVTGGLAAAALAVTAVATLVAVSTGARPGDVLYGLKRGTEQTQLALAGDSRGRTLLDFASTRLAELSQLPAGNAALAVSTLHTMDQQASEGAAWLGARAVQTHSAAPVLDLTAWSHGQSDGLSALAPKLPPAAQDDAAHSLDLLSRIDARATALTIALSCASGPAVHGTDALGPVPIDCPVATPSTGGSSGGTTGIVPGTGSTPSTGTGSVPGGTTDGTGGTGGTGSGGASTVTGGTGTGGTTTTTGIPGLPLPSTGLPLPSSSPPPIINVPAPLPLPVPTLPGSTPSSSAGSGSTGGGTGGSGGSGGGGGIGICLPPLVGIGDC